MIDNDFKELIEAHGQQDVDAAFRRIVLRSPKEYPSLASTEMKKNARRFEEETARR